MIDVEVDCICQSVFEVDGGGRRICELWQGCHKVATSWPCASSFEEK